MKNIEIVKGKNNIVIVDNLAYILIESETFGKKVAIIDSIDVERITNHSWNYTRRGYVTTNIFLDQGAGKKKKKKTLYLHRLIMNCDFIVDHKNHDMLDNRRENLRTGTTKEEAILINLQNKCVYKNSPIGIRGVNAIFNPKTKKYVWTINARIGKLHMRRRFKNLAEALTNLEQWRVKHMIGYIQNKENISETIINML